MNHVLRDGLEQLVRRYSHWYERPHAVVLAQTALEEEVRALGFTLQGPERLPGGPYERRYVLEPGHAVIQGTFDIPNTLIRIAVQFSE